LSLILDQFGPVQIGHSESQYYTQLIAEPGDLCQPSTIARF